MGQPAMIIAVIIAAFLFIASVKMKLENGREGGVAFDIALLVLLLFLFHRTAAGMAVGVIVAAGVSVWMLVSPPDIDWDK